MKKSILSLVVLSATLLEASVIDKAFDKAITSGQIRVGSVVTEDENKEDSSTLALGGTLGIKTEAVSGVSLGATFYTTNALFKEDENSMFLSSENKGYSIIGEAYIQAQLREATIIKLGRQIVETPYVQSDDIGMVPNTFEGVTLINQDIADTTIILGSLNKWAGIDSAVSEQFTTLQTSGNEVYAGGIIYEGIENATFQTWQYRLDDTIFNYVEAGYETKTFLVSGQYSNQDKGNAVFGVLVGVNMGNLTINTAYNKVEGEVVNGFGGGPFFTSSQDHTIADVVDQEAILLGAEYTLEDVTLAVTHVNFTKGENETDYLLSYAVDDVLSIDVIHSEMYQDGTLSRVFVNYNF